MGRFSHTNCLVKDWRETRNSGLSAHSPVARTSTNKEYRYTNQNVPPRPHSALDSGKQKPHTDKTIPFLSQLSPCDEIKFPNHLHGAILASRQTILGVGSPRAKVIVQNSVYYRTIVRVFYGSWLESV